MAKISEKIKCCVMSISFQERKKRELMRYRQEIVSYRKLKDDEIDLAYINMKSEYEHKKNILSIFMLSIVISVLMDSWKYFYTFIEKTIQYASINQVNGTETAKVAFVISVMAVVFITAIIFIILIMHMRRMKRMYKELMIIEEIRNKRKD